MAFGMLKAGVSPRKVEDIVAASRAATQFELEVDNTLWILQAQRKDPNVKVAVDSELHPELIAEVEDCDPEHECYGLHVHIGKRNQEVVRRMKGVLEERGWTARFELQREDEAIVWMTRGDESLLIHNPPDGQVWIED